jgi:uncharacterized protein
VSAILRAKALLLALALGWAQAALADVAVPPAPPPTARVVDLTGALSGEDIAMQARRLIDFQRRKRSQIAVLIVPTTQPETIEQYSIRVAESWKIGRKKVDDGVLLVVATDDRKMRIEVGYGLEGALTDSTARRIIDETIAPRFKAGDFSGGIAAGITRMIAVIDGETLPEPKHENDRWWSGLVKVANPIVLITAYLFGWAARSWFGRLGGSLAAGAGYGGLVWLATASLATGAFAGAVLFVITFFFGALLGEEHVRSRRHVISLSNGWGGGWHWNWNWNWNSGSSSSSSSSGSSSSSNDNDSGGSFGGGGASGSW